MGNENRLHCSFPQEMLVVFGSSAALEAAKPLMEELAGCSDDALFRLPPFSTAAGYCRRALNDELVESDFASFLTSLSECVLASLTCGHLSEEQRYFGGALFELEQALVHPFCYDISAS